MSKRINKTEAELRAALKDKQGNENKQAFLAEYEQTIEAMGIKYGLILIPIIRYTEYGIQPVFAVDVYKPNQKPNDVDSQSETNNRADSDD